MIDPKNFSPTAFVDIEGDYCIIPPNSFALAETAVVEYFEIASDVLAVCSKIDVMAAASSVNVNAAGAGMARQDHHRDQQHDALAREDLRQRGDRADSVLPRRRGLRNELRRQEGEIPGSKGADATLCRRPRAAALNDVLVEFQ